MSKNPKSMSMAELVNETKKVYELSWAEMGSRLNRNDKIFRRVSKGEQSGEKYRKALTELYETGLVKHEPPRPRDKSGNIVRVRGKKNKDGTESPSVAPTEHRGTFVGQVKRGKFKYEVTDLAEGNKLHHIELPKTETSAGRKDGLAKIKDTLQRITKSQRSHDKRVKMKVTIQDEDGSRRQYELGSNSGYHASDILNDIKTDCGGDFNKWFGDELNKVYEGLGGSVVSIEMNEFKAKRSKDERKEEDRAGTRRRRWSR